MAGGGLAKCVVMKGKAVALAVVNAWGRQNVTCGIRRAVNVLSAPRRCYVLCEIVRLRCPLTQFGMVGDLKRCGGLDCVLWILSAASLCRGTARQGR